LILADALREAVLPDWSNFDHRSEVWRSTAEILNNHIGGLLDKIAQTKSEARRKAIIDRMRSRAREMAPIDREKWNTFIKLVVNQCPSMTESDLLRLAGILANLEVAQSQYGLLGRLHRAESSELHDLNHILNEWSVATAKIVLSQVQERLNVIHELKRKMYNKSTHEVGELQPLFERGLWMFGPEFESIEFTSNEGMTTVIQSLFKKNDTGTLLRPDFVILPDATLGIYARPGYDTDGKDAEFERIVIVELKRPRIAIGQEQRTQAEKYVVELRKKGCLRNTRIVDVFVMGSELDEDWGSPSTVKGLPPAHIIPMMYETLVKRAEKRMMNLYKLVKSAPFLNPAEIDRFLDPDADSADPGLPFQPTLIAEERRVAKDDPDPQSGEGTGA
jgi:hypothetical protein